jgi:hypothetical protein
MENIVVGQCLYYLYHMYTRKTQYVQGLVLSLAQAAPAS